MYIDIDIYIYREREEGREKEMGGMDLVFVKSVRKIQQTLLVLLLLETVTKN